MSLHCRNCGHAESVVLLVELAAEVRTDEGGGPRAAGRDWSLDAACTACSSTDLAGDPNALLDRVTPVGG
ncbi:hypothetical protein [Halobaculum sp. MBLA0143]|uniref:hypothetical protein n=1 Tax=Halobaculum sp. MBLA0143 TaxID=3079933 RepID=UPI003523BFA1